MSGLTRHQALQIILPRLRNSDLAIFTTGFISREACAVRDRPQNFYMIGSMGLLSSMGLGLALRRPDQRVIIVEGDGSALMSMGTLALIGCLAPKNLVHIVLDNESYDSTGGQPSITTNLNLADVASSCGYRQRAVVTTAPALFEVVETMFAGDGPNFLLTKIIRDDRPEASRVPIEPLELCARFQNAVMLDRSGGG